MRPLPVIKVRQCRTTHHVKWQPSKSRGFQLSRTQQHLAPLASRQLVPPALLSHQAHVPAIQSLQMHPITADADADAVPCPGPTFTHVCMTQVQQPGRRRPLHHTCGTRLRTAQVSPGLPYASLFMHGVRLHLEGSLSPLPANCLRFSTMLPLSIQPCFRLPLCASASHVVTPS